MKSKSLALMALFAILVLTVMVVAGCTASSTTPSTGGTS